MIAYKGVTCVHMLAYTYRTHLDVHTYTCIVHNVTILEGLKRGMQENHVFFSEGIPAKYSHPIVRSVRS